jgi:hypothetical protein
MVGGASDQAAGRRVEDFVCVAQRDSLMTSKLETVVIP